MRSCYNRYSPYIPLAMTVPSGSVVEFKTRDLWDRPGWDMSGKPDAGANFDKVRTLVEPSTEDGVIYLIGNIVLSRRMVVLGRFRS